MSKPALHPWLNTPDAVKAAERAVKVPEYKMPAAAKVVGLDELLSEAFAILTECALPPRERITAVCVECGDELKNVRVGAKYCGAKCRNLAGVRRHRAGGAPPPPSRPKGHVGSMHSWPEDEMVSFAIREVGLQLCNYLRTRVGRSEVPASPHLENADLPEEADVEGVRGVLEDYLVSHEWDFSDDDTTEDLLDAVQCLRFVASECCVSVAA